MLKCAGVKTSPCVDLVFDQDWIDWEFKFEDTGHD